MGRTGSGKSHPISKSLQTNAGPGSMKIEPGLFVFASSLTSPHLKNRAAYLFASTDVKASNEIKVRLREELLPRFNMCARVLPAKA